MPTDNIDFGNVGGTSVLFNRSTPFSTLQTEMGNQWLADELGVEISDHGGFYVLVESKDLHSP